MSTSRYSAVTPLPIVVAYPPIDMTTEGDSNHWIYELLEGFADTDYIELPPDAAGDVMSLDKVRRRKLEREMDAKLSPQQVADIFHFAKLIDAVRLAEDKESRKLCLMALEQAHGTKHREAMERAFKGNYAEDILEGRLTWICLISRLGLIFPKEGDAPRVAIVAPNLFDAICMQIVLSLHQSQAAAYCEQCGSSYVRHTQEQKFCSERCANRERQARFRARLQKRRKQP